MVVSGAKTLRVLQDLQLLFFSASFYPSALFFPPPGCTLSSIRQPYQTDIDHPGFRPRLPFSAAGASLLMLRTVAV